MTTVQYTTNTSIRSISNDSDAPVDNLSPLERLMLEKSDKDNLTGFDQLIGFKQPSKDPVQTPKDSVMPPPNIPPSPEKRIDPGVTGPILDNLKPDQDSQYNEALEAAKKDSRGPGWVLGTFEEGEGNLIQKLYFSEDAFKAHYYGTGDSAGTPRKPEVDDIGGDPIGGEDGDGSDDAGVGVGGAL